MRSNNVTCAALRSVTGSLLSTPGVGHCVSVAHNLGVYQVEQAFQGVTLDGESVCKWGL